MALERSHFLTTEIVEGFGEISHFLTTEIVDGFGEISHFLTTEIVEGFEERYTCIKEALRLSKR